MLSHDPADIVAQLRDALAEARVMLTRAGYRTPGRWSELIGPEPRCTTCGAVSVAAEPTTFGATEHRCGQGRRWVSLAGAVL